MQLQKIGILALVLLAATSAAAAGWFEISLNGDAFDLGGGAHLGDDPDGRLALGGRFLYNEDHDTKLGCFLGAFASEPPSVEGFEFAVGGEALVGKGEDRDVAALALGVEATWAPPRLKGLFFGARLFYAPGVFSWGDSDGVTDWSARVGFRVTKKIDVFAQYQRVEADLDTRGDTELDGGVLVGFGGRF